MDFNFCWWPEKWGDISPGLIVNECLDCWTLLLENGECEFARTLSYCSFLVDMLDDGPRRSLSFGERVEIKAKPELRQASFCKVKG